MGGGTLNAPKFLTERGVGRGAWAWGDARSSLLVQRSGIHLRGILATR